MSGDGANGEAIGEAIGEDMSATLDVLRGSELFAACGPETLQGVVRRSGEIVLAPGELLFTEADHAEAVWVVLEGDLVVSTLADGDEVILDHLHPGGWLGEISLLTATPARHRARARSAVRLLRIPGAVFRALLGSCDGVMAGVLRTLAGRMRRAEHLLQQRERMAGLGTAAAGLTHELNNPTSAAHRNAEVLCERIDELDALGQRLARRTWSEAEVRLLEQLGACTAATERPPTVRDALERSDREDALAQWLEAHDVERGWERAPGLVDLGLSPAMLDPLVQGCAPDAVADALAWAERMGAARQLVGELSRSTGRMAEIVKAVKAYSYADTSTTRSADLREGIGHSVTILGHKLRDAMATVERDFDPALPPVEVHGTELTQVWTNLLDNAADAVKARGGGTIRIRTRRDGDEAVVEIADSGAGIAPEIAGRVFDPFFTTKEVGKGTGLGLVIVKRIVLRHQGSIQLDTGETGTRFTVRLPLRQRTDPPAAPGDAPAEAASLAAAPRT